MQTQEKYARFVNTSFVKGLEPLVVASAEGAHIRDQEGREYIDCYSGIAVVNAGHRHPKVIAAVKRQLEAYVHCQSYTYYLPVVADFAERLATVMPQGLTKTFFGNSGAEAIETALRMAKAYTGRHEFIALEQSFHGRSAGSLSVTGNAARKVHGGPYLPGVFFAATPDVYRSPFGDDPDVIAQRCAESVERAILFHSAGDVAAFIAEPVMGEGGMIVPPAKYFPLVKEILDRHGILFIADEVQSGFGRTGKLFAIEHFGVVPDILVTAKGIADGFPLSGVTARPEVADAFKPGEHLSTFGGNPVSCAAGLANLEVMLSEDLPGRSARLGAQAKATLERLTAHDPHVGNVRGKGLMIGVDLVTDRTSKQPFGALAAKVRSALREEGILIGVGGQAGNVLRIQPPLVIEEADLDRAVQRIAAAVSSMAVEVRA